ncbi:hypothetical protein ABPG74_021352 [Tetrahymena malaccensis]
MKNIQSQDNMMNFKFIIVGDSGVGKSCMLIRYSKNDFVTDYNATIGVEFQSKIVKINDASVKLQIWDTAGQESFRSIVKSFYKKTVGVLLVYNIANKESFQSIKHWLVEAKENSEESATFVLVGAQSDREKDRKVSREEAEQFQKANQIDLFFETSSKNNSFIDECFEKTAQAAFMKQVNQQLKKSFQGSSFISNNGNIRSHNQSVPIKQQSTRSSNKSGCC